MNVETLHVTSLHFWEIFVLFNSVTRNPLSGRHYKPINYKNISQFVSILRIEASL
jgi:hypothetical protein